MRRTAGAALGSILQTSLHGAAGAAPHTHWSAASALVGDVCPGPALVQMATKPATVSPPYLWSQLCPSLRWHIWFAFYAVVARTRLQWIPFAWIQSVSSIYQDRFSKPVPERLPRLSQPLVMCVFQQWALFSNYSLRKKQYRCRW